MHDIVMRAATSVANSFDAATGTVKITFSSPHPVFNPASNFEEVLSHELGAVDLTRLAGGPVLDNHKRDSVASVIGRIMFSTIENGQGVATIQLADDTLLRSKVRDGIINQWSVAAQVKRDDWRVVVNGPVKRRVAVRWQPYEISATGFAADPNAITRNQNMPEVTPEARQTAVANIARVAHLDDAWMTRVLATEDDLPTIRRQAMEEMERGSVETRRIRPTTSHDDPTVRLRSLGDALFHRVAGGTPPEAARPFMGHSLRDMAREILVMRGVSTAGLDVEGIFRAALHGTTDFPQLLGGMGQRQLMAAYTAATSPVVALARSTTFNDFRLNTKLRLSGIGKLEKVNEHGEITGTSRSEVAESYKLESFGKLFGLTRQGLINDDLGAFSDWSSAAGRSAAETVASGLVDLLVSNPIMEDGFALFSTQHKNLAAVADSPSGTSFDLLPLAVARKALRDTKGLTGEPINAVGKFLLVGSDLEVEAEKCLAQIYAATAADVNPTRLSLAVESRLPPLAWYVFADPGIMPVLEQATLSSAPGPQMASREGWDILGLEFRVVLDWACAAIDWRGAFKNNGAA